jgi:hypothetical protein
LRDGLRAARRVLVGGGGHRPIMPWRPSAGEPGGPRDPYPKRGVGLVGGQAGSVVTLAAAVACKCSIRNGRLAQPVLSMSAVIRPWTTRSAAGRSGVSPSHRFARPPMTLRQLAAPQRDIAGNRDPWWRPRGCEGPRPDAKVASDPVAPSRFLREVCNGARLSPFFYQARFRAS